MTSVSHHIQPPGTFSRIVTLLERERRTRFAGGMVGYLWAYITPVVWIGFVVILFRVLERSPPIYVGPEVFVATGILPYISFRQSVTSLSRSIAAQRHMRYIQPVGINDILTATGHLKVPPSKPLFLRLCVKLLKRIIGSQCKLVILKKGITIPFNHCYQIPLQRFMKTPMP